jgi:hypothetical protein
VRSNLFAGCAAPRADGWPVGSGDIVAADAGFVDPDGGDSRLRFDSPARGAGRPSFIDIGAMQRRELAPHGATNVGMQT